MTLVPGSVHLVHLCLSVAEITLVPGSVHLVHLCLSVAEMTLVPGSVHLVHLCLSVAEMTLVRTRSGRARPPLQGADRWQVELPMRALTLIFPLLPPPLQLWDVETGTERASLLGHKAEIVSLNFNTTGGW